MRLGLISPTPCGEISSRLCLAEVETRRYKPASQVGAWLSPVEHCVRDAGVAGSNPAAPTILSRFRSGSSSYQDGSRTIIASAPTERGGDVRQDRLDHVRIVGDAQLIGDREQQRIGLGDGLILLELLDQNVWLGGVAPAEDRARVGVD